MVNFLDHTFHVFLVCYSIENKPVWLETRTNSSSKGRNRMAARPAHYYSISKHKKREKRIHIAISSLCELNRKTKKSHKKLLFTTKNFAFIEMRHIHAKILGKQQLSAQYESSSGSSALVSSYNKPPPCFPFSAERNIQ